LSSEGLTLSESDYYSKYLGYDDVGAFSQMAADWQLLWDKNRIAALVSRKAQQMEELERKAGVLFPGAEEAIRSAARALPIAIASGALSAEIRRILDRFELTALFTAIVAAEDTATSKPAPDPYLRAVELLSQRHGAMAPDECVALEDSQWGLQSAHAAGLRTVGVAHTYAADTLRPADLVIPSMREFNLRTLQRLFS
jgi:beta-phosphoglucomutase